MYEGDDHTEMHALEDVCLKERRSHEGDVNTAVLEDTTKEEQPCLFIGKPEITLDIPRNQSLREFTIMA